MKKPPLLGTGSGEVAGRLGIKGLSLSSYCIYKQIGNSWTKVNLFV